MQQVITFHQAYHWVKQESKRHVIHHFHCFGALQILSRSPLYFL